MTHFDNTSSITGAMWSANQTEIPDVIYIAPIPDQRTIPRSLRKKLEFVQLGMDIQVHNPVYCYSGIDWERLFDVYYAQTFHAPKVGLCLF